MSNWRDRLAVYPSWNKGTFYVKGQVTYRDFIEGRIRPSGKPGSIAGPKPFDAEKGGGPYDGQGNEILIRDAPAVVRDREFYEMPP